MASTPYLTPPPTVPATRHHSVARPGPPAPTLFLDPHHPPPLPLSAGHAPRFNLPYPVPSHLQSHSPSSLAFADPYPPINPYFYPPTSPYPPVHVPRPHPPPHYAMPVTHQTHVPTLLRPLPNTTVSLAQIQPIPDHVITAALQTSRDELDDSPPASPNVRAEKRRRTKKATGNGSSEAGRPAGASPSAGSGAGASPHSNESAVGDHLAHPSNPQRRPSGLAPIKPIGFAASRENRRESGGANGGAAVGDAPLPSPVVMGFDYQKVDEDQLKTVRDTISIKAQQEALIAQRRRDLAASTPNTPKELTFKGWQPKDTRIMSGPESPVIGSGGVGRRREKTRDKVERMSIVTSGGGGMDAVPGSQSAPMNQGLSAQQPSERGDMPSGSQTSVPSGQHTNGPIDPRNAPMSNVRGSRGDEGEFGRQQAVPVTGQYYRRYETSHGRSVTEGGQRSGVRIIQSASRGYDDRMPPPVSGHPSRNGHPGPSAAYTTQDHSDGSASPPPSRSHQHPPTSAMSHQPLPTGGLSGLSGPSSMAPGGVQQISARREAFLAPYNQLYDLLHRADGLQYSLQDLMNRYEGLYAAQVARSHEFKGQAAAANTLLNNLQQSAESLKEMVRYEVARAIPAQQAQANGSSGSTAGGSGLNAGERKELEDLRERMRVLEEKMSKDK